MSREAQICRSGDGLQLVMAPLQNQSRRCQTIVLRRFHLNLHRPPAFPSKAAAAKPSTAAHRPSPPLPLRASKISGTTLTWTFEYEKMNEAIPDPDAFVDLANKVTKQIDSHQF